MGLLQSDVMQSGGCRITEKGLYLLLLLLKEADEVGGQNGFYSRNSLKCVTSVTK
jgi:hypothetical protein